MVELKPKIELKIAGYCSKNNPFRLLYIRIHIWTKNKMVYDLLYIETRLGLKIDPGVPGIDLKITYIGLKIEGRRRPFRLKITTCIVCV